MSGEETQRGIGDVLEREDDCVVRIRGAAEDELDSDEQPEHSHGKEQRIAPNCDFAVEHLLADPEQKKSRGADFEKKDGPGFDCAEGERPKQKQTENSV